MLMDFDATRLNIHDLVGLCVLSLAAAHGIRLHGWDQLSSWLDF